MTINRDYQHSAIISVNDFPLARDYQQSAIISVTEIPFARNYQQSIIISVTPPNRYIYGAQKVVTKSPQNLLVDMFANSRR